MSFFEDMASVHIRAKAFVPRLQGPLYSLLSLASSCHSSETAHSFRHSNRPYSRGLEQEVKLSHIPFQAATQRSRVLLASFLRSLMACPSIDWAVIGTPEIETNGIGPSCRFHVAAGSDIGRRVRRPRAQSQSRSVSAPDGLLCKGYIRRIPSPATFDHRHVNNSPSRPLWPR